MRTLICLVGLVALAPATASADHSSCPSTDWGVSTLALEVEQAYIAGDLGDLLAALYEVQDAVDCLEEPVSRETAASVHRAVALAASWQEDWDLADRAWQAAIAAEPGWEPQGELAPPGGRLAASIERARSAPAPRPAMLRAPSSLALRLDGAPAWQRQEGLPVMLQLIDSDGRPVENHYLTPGATLPPTVHARSSADKSGSSERRASSPSRKTPILLTVGAGTLAGTALGLGVASGVVRSDWKAASERCEARPEGCFPGTDRMNDNQHLLARRLGIGAGAAAAGSVALGVGVALTW